MIWIIVQNVKVSRLQLTAVGWGFMMELLLAFALNVDINFPDQKKNTIRLYSNVIKYTWKKMAKTKQKTHSKTEHLEGQIKTLKSENRQLRKRLKELERKSHFYEDIIVEEVEDIKSVETCNKCGKGTASVLDLKYVKLLICDLCEHKEKIR